MLKADTKQILANSLEELLKTRSFESITVQEIVKNCNASRTAFYNHFDDKYELMIWINKNYVDALIMSHSQPNSWKDLTLSISNFIYEKREYFSKVVDYKGQNSIPDFWVQYGSRYLVSLLKIEFGSEILPKELLYAVKMFTTGASVATLDWIKSGMTETPEEISRIICACIPIILLEHLK